MRDRDGNEKLRGTERQRRKVEATRDREIEKERRSYER